MYSSDLLCEYLSINSFINSALVILGLQLLNNVLKRKSHSYFAIIYRGSIKKNTVTFDVTYKSCSSRIYSWSFIVFGVHCGFKISNKYQLFALRRRY